MPSVSFYASMTIIKNDDHIIQSFVLGTHIEYNLKLLCQILGLPNKSDQYYLTTFDDLPAHDKSEFKVYTAITNTGGKVKIATHLKKACRVVSK